MTDPDRAPKPVMEAALAAGQQIKRVWELAFAQGIREGMEVGAKVCDSVAVTTRTKPEGVSMQDVAAIATAEFLRDQIRQLALEVDDPPPLQNATPPPEKE